MNPSMLINPHFRIPSSGWRRPHLWFQGVEQNLGAGSRPGFGQRTAERCMEQHIGCSADWFLWKGERQHVRYNILQPKKMELQNHPEILVGYFSVFFWFVCIHTCFKDRWNCWLSLGKVGDEIRELGKTCFSSSETYPTNGCYSDTKITRRCKIA